MTLKDVFCAEVLQKVIINGFSPIEKSQFLCYNKVSIFVRCRYGYQLQ